MLIRALLLGGLAVAGSCGSSSEPTTTTHVTPDTTTTPFVPPVTPAAKGWVKGAVSGAGLTNPYQVFVPLNYDASRKWPVIVFLHSATERGTDNVLQTTVGLGPVIKAQESTFPAIAIFPQVGLNESQRSGYLRVSMSSLDSVLKVYNGDPTRIYLTGISAGGSFAYEVLHLNPGRFAAFMPMAADICPVCITGSTSSSQTDAALILAREMPTMAYWQFQGDQDCCIPVQEARDITTAWKSVNPSVKYTEYKGVGHADTHLHAYAEPTIFTWLFAQHR